MCAEYQGSSVAVAKAIVLADRKKRERSAFVWNSSGMGVKSEKPERDPLNQIAIRVLLSVRK